jgi:hypothetical protein
MILDAKMPNESGLPLHDPAAPDTNYPFVMFGGTPYAILNHPGTVKMQRASRAPSNLRNRVLSLRSRWCTHVDAEAVRTRLDAIIQ